MTIIVGRRVGLVGIAPCARPGPRAARCFACLARRGSRPADMDGRRQALPRWHVHDAALVAVVHRGRRPDRAQHRGPKDRPHAPRSQRRYFEWMRERNRYDLPLSAGVDPAGWTAGLRHFVDDRYRLVSSRTFEGALRSAVTRLRLTGLPVALAVSHGNHGWILTGFRATADPAPRRRSG